MMLQKPFISDTYWSVDPAQATTQTISRRENDILKQACFMIRAIFQLLCADSRPQRS